MTQLVTRINQDLVAQIDDLVERGVFASRSEAVRRGLLHLLDEQARQHTAAAIIEGYNRLPQTQEDVGWSDEATTRMIGDEPW